MAGLNRSPNIEWIHPKPEQRFTLNPLGSWCLNGCWFCYRARGAHRLPCPQCRTNEPHHHLDRLQALVKTPAGAGVFVGSVCDFWSNGVQPEWRQEIFKAIKESLATCFVLTKRPERIDPAEIPGLPDNLWLGVSVSCQDEAWRIGRLADRWPGHRFLSLEPLLGPVDLNDRYLDRIEWVVIGGLSGPWLPPGWTVRDSLLRAQAEWSRDILGQCQAAGLPVVVKTIPVKIPELKPVRQWPGPLMAAPWRRPRPEPEAQARLF
ncbi:MAG: DUF5131 family protein [Deltaproteobacteria bacterium]|nr:DUF5131 family protein [Deltaproteobacteria bacterium]